MTEQDISPTPQPEPFIESKVLDLSDISLEELRTREDLAPYVARVVQEVLRDDSSTC